MTALLSDHRGIQERITDADVLRLESLHEPDRFQTVRPHRPLQTLTWPGVLSAANEEPIWLRPTVESLVTLLRIPAGWDSYGAQPVALELALAALRFLCDVAGPDTPPPSVVPTASGGVQLEWHRNDIDLEIVTISESKFMVSFEDASTGKQWEDTVSADLKTVVEILSRLH